MPRRPVTPRAILLAFIVAAALALAPAALSQDDAASSTGIRPDGSSAAAPADAPGSPGEPTVDVVATGLNAATNIAFGPDGSLYFGEWKTGAVYRIGEDGRPENYGSPLIDVGDPAWGNERGFVGLALDHEGNFYTFTTYNHSSGDGFFNRVSKWVDGEEVILLDNLPAGDWHNAGRILVDPRDNTLWVAYGDVNGYEVAQDTTDLRGSILHMTTDGEPVEGNIAPDSLIWSIGHRQPFGFAVDWPTGRVIVAENMDKKNDEVSVVEAGGNYGWPECEGPCDPPRAEFTDPVIYYEQTIGPTSGAWMAGEYYFGDFNYGQLHRVYEHEGQWFDEIVYTHTAPPFLDLKPGPEGNTLYFSTWSEIHRLTFADVEPAPPQWYDPETGGAGNPDLTPPTGNGGGGEPPGGNGNGGEEPPQESKPIPAGSAALALGALAAAAAVVVRRS